MTSTSAHDRFTSLNKEVKAIGRGQHGVAVGRLQALS